MFKILSTYICLKNIYKMQHPEGSGTPVLYIGRTVLKGQYNRQHIAYNVLNINNFIFIIK
jgi:hypothetical protein